MNRWRLVVCESRTAHKEVDTRMAHDRTLLCAVRSPIFGLPASQASTGGEHRRVHRIGRHTDGATVRYGDCRAHSPDGYQTPDTLFSAT